MSRTGRIAAYLAAGTAMAFAGSAAAAVNLANWSYAEVGIGSCNAATCNATHPPVYISRPKDQGFNHNASISGSDPTRGSGSAWVSMDDFPSLPDLHAISTGAPDAAGAKSWNFSFTEAAVGFRWTGKDLSVPLDTFVGTLSFSNTGTFFGQTIGQFAVIDQSFDDPAVAALYTSDNGAGGFVANCSTTGAEAIMSTGTITTKGAHQVATTHSLCAMPTINFVHNQDVWFVSRAFTFVFGNETVDASNTFGIDFNASASPTLQRYIATHVAPIGSPSGTPEPSGWALMLLGFGALGATLRSRRTAAGAH